MHADSFTGEIANAILGDDPDPLGTVSTSSKEFEYVTSRVFLQIRSSKFFLDSSKKRKEEGEERKQRVLLSNSSRLTLKPGIKRESPFPKSQHQTS